MASVGANALCSLEEGRAYLKIETADHDAWLAAMIDMVTGSAEVYTKRKLITRVYDGASGHEPAMVLNGTGARDISLREFPCTAVTEATELYEDGTTTRTMDLTGARLIMGGRRLWLPYDSFPRGQANILLKCTAGYVSGVHDSELRTLKLAALRMLQVSWQDYELALGRGTTIGVGNESVSVLATDLPEDVKTLLRPFERW